MLQVFDEVLNGSPRYNIISNGDGTSNISLATEIIQNGTPINKALFKDINNVVYEIPESWSQEEVQIEKEGMPLYSDWINNGTTATYNEMKINVSSVYNNNSNYAPSHIFNTDDNYRWISQSSSSEWVLLDFGKEIQSDKIFTRCYGGTSSTFRCNVTASTDNINYTTLFTFSSNTEYYNGKREHSFAKTNFRYLRFEMTDPNNAMMSLSNLEIPGAFYYDQKMANNFTINNITDLPRTNQRITVDMTTSNPFTNVGVGVSRINGVICEDLLEYGKQYKLKYNGNLYKTDFELPKPLFDITLTQAVNRVDLTGIYDMFEENKIYLLKIIGNSSSNSVVSMGTGQIAYIYSADVYSQPLSLFTIRNMSGRKQITYWTYNSSQLVCSYNTITKNTNEYIKLDSSYKFNVGTRIIIKEVA